MTYDSRKILNSQEYVQEIELVLDACKFTSDPNYKQFAFATTSGGTVSSGYTGSISLAATNANVQWAGVSSFYAVSQSTGEIMKVSALTASVITISSRGQFGTTAAAITSGTFLTMKHQGEVDGTCRGFPFNCSNSDSYLSTAKKRLIFSSGNNAGGLLRFAGLRKVSHDAGEVDPGESIGTRASLKCDISNGVHNDYGIVPYPEKQTSNGTLFGKLLARHPYFQGREILFREGYRDANTFQSPDFIERKFIIDSVNLSNEVFSVTALDPLILTEDKKAQMPVSSPATLSAAITGSPATFSFLNAASFYFGAMAETVYVRIDSEIIKCTVSGATQLTVVTRGYRSSVKDHSAGTSIQDCVVFSGTHGIDAIVFAMDNYTAIPSSFIDSYASVIALLPSFVLHETIISKPMPVADFITTLIQLGNLVFGYNEETQKISIEYTPELDIQPITIDQAVDIQRGSVAVDMNVKNQWTRLAYLFAPVDVTKDTEENFAVRFLSANVSLESAEYLGQVNEKKTIKNILLDNSTGDSLLATSYVGRVLQNNQTIPKIINLTLDASKVGNISGGVMARGSVVSLSTKYNEDKDGNPLAELYQVLKLSGDGYKGFKAKLRRYQALQPSSVDYVISVGGINYDLAAHFAPAAGHYKIYINPNVEFGSYSTSLPAFTTGSQAVGVTFEIIHRGRILGMGGNGGDCGIPFPASAGLDGGTAFNATVSCTIDCGSGIIWAGGGGGGGTISDHAGTIYTSASGGGGGQGYGSSVGGRYTNGNYSGLGLPSYDGFTEGGNQSGPGYNGGEWGKQGESISSQPKIAFGGLSGVAIKTNGNSVTIVAGNNDLNIRGRRV